MRAYVRTYVHVYYVRAQVPLNYLNSTSGTRKGMRGRPILARNQIGIINAVVVVDRPKHIIIVIAARKQPPPQHPHPPPRDQHVRGSP